MLEGIPRRISEFRDTMAGQILPWAIALGAAVLDLTTLRESPDQRWVVVVALSIGALLVYGIIRLLIGRGVANERIHDVSVQLAGFLTLFLGVVALFWLVRALTDRAFAATMGIFHGSWALGAIDGYLSGIRSNVQESELVLFSPLTPSECASTLRTAIDLRRFPLFSLSMLGTKPVIGWVDDSSMQLRKRIPYRNSFQPLLSATMRPEENGTLIEGAFSFHRFVHYTLLFCFGFGVLLGGLMWAVGAVRAARGEALELWLWILPPALLAIGVLVVRWGKRLARGEAQELREFLMATLQAHEAGERRSMAGTRPETP